MKPAYEQFSVLNSAVGVSEVYSTQPDRLDFSPGEGNTGLEAFLNEIIVEGLPVISHGFYSVTGHLASPSVCVKYSGYSGYYIIHDRHQYVK